MIKELVQERVRREQARHDIWHGKRVGKYHASSIGDACLRKLYWGFDQPHSFSIGTLMTFTVGNIFHDYLKETVRKEFDSDFLTEEPIVIKIDPEIVIVGKADMVIPHPLTRRVFEFKTCKNLPDYPYKQHRWQVECYCRGLNAQEAVIVYVRKRDFSIAEFVITAKTSRWKKITARAKKLHNSIENNNLPDKNENALCGWCGYKDQCSQISDE